MQVAADKVVLIHYTLTNDGGEVIDSSSGGDPLAYIHGLWYIIPGLEKALEGREAGDKLEVRVNAATGSLESVLWKETGREIVDASKDFGMAEYFYVPGKDPALAERSGPPTITVKERGPLVASLLVTSAAPGCTELVREIVLAASCGGRIHG